MSLIDVFLAILLVQCYLILYGYKETVRKEVRQRVVDLSTTHIS